MKKLFVDRIEGEFAVCQTEDEAVINLPLSHLGFEVKEGSVISENNGAYELLIDEEEKRRNANFKLAESLFDE